MERNKFDFIKELLNDGRINPKQREKILHLASKEIGDVGMLETRIEKIEMLLLNPEVKPSTSQHEINEPIVSLDFEYIDPFNLYKFLFKYNQNPILRSTCHDIDSDELNSINEYCKTKSYDFITHLEKIIEAYRIHEKQNFAPPYLKALIRAYLTGEDYKGLLIKGGWSSDKIKINWSSKNLIDWTKQNPTRPPNLSLSRLGDFEIEAFDVEQIDSPITGESIQNFTQLVLHFKNLFHLKSGDQSLLSIISRVNSIKKWNESVDFEISADTFSDNLEHFTDVDKLIQAYNILMKLIIEQHSRNIEKPIVRLSFLEVEECVRLSIHHINTKYNKSITNVINRGNGQTYNSLIKNQINGLCNLYLNADFGNSGYAKINLWNGEKRAKQPLSSFKGVEHILEFPTKTTTKNDLSYR
jgi:hypothetical protein